VDPRCGLLGQKRLQRASTLATGAARPRDGTVGQFSHADTVPRDLRTDST